jgi:hypothetical protein
MPGMSVSAFFRRWGPAIVIMAAIFAFSSIPGEEVPHFGGFDLSLKKGGHMLGYAFLGASYWAGLGFRRPRAALLAWLLCVGYALTDELHQSFTPGRAARLSDVGIDALGGAVGLWTFRAWLLQKIPHGTLH